MKTKSLQSVLSFYAIICFALLAALYIFNANITAAYLDLDFETATAESLENIELPMSTLLVFLFTPLIAEIAAIHIAVGRKKTAHNGKFKIKVWALMVFIFAIDALLLFASSAISLVSYIPGIFYVIHVIGKSIVPIETGSQTIPVSNEPPTAATSGFSPILTAELPVFKPFNQSTISSRIAELDPSLNFIYARGNISLGTFALAGYLASATMTFYIIAWNNQNIHIFELSKFNNSKVVNQSVIPQNSVKSISGKIGWIFAQIKIETTDGIIKLNANKKIVGFGNQTKALEKFLQI